MNGFTTTLRCAAVTTCAVVSWTGVALAGNGGTPVRTREFSNTYVRGYAQIAIEDGKTVFGEVYAEVPDGKPGWVSVTSFKLQRHACGTKGWQTRLSKPAKDGFHDWSDIVLGRTALGGRRSVAGHGVRDLQEAAPRAGAVPRADLLAEDRRLPSAPAAALVI